jgi:hypothetical protein
MYGERVVLVSVGVRLHELSGSSMPVPESRDESAGRRDQGAGGQPDPAQGAGFGGDRAGTFMFEQVARLELDELPEQLIARARDVQDTQGRLRGLLRANLEVARGIDTDEVLRHIVDAARVLVNAATENAILFAESGRRQAWQSAMVDVTTRLLTGTSPHDAPVPLVHHARVTSSSDGAAIAVATDDPSVLRVTVTDGVYGPWQDRTFAHDGSAALWLRVGLFWASTSQWTRKPWPTHRKRVRWVPR